MSFQSFDINNMDFNELNKYFSNFIEENNSRDVGNLDNLNNPYDHDNSNHFINKSIKKNINECLSCEGTNFVEDYSQGIVVCTNCGEVFRTIFDQNPEWKQYDDDDKAGARCNQVFNVLLPQSSLGTSIAGYAHSRPKRLHGWVPMPYKERSLNNEFKVIHEICQKAGILKCVEDDTKIMYKIASECKHQTGAKAGKQVITRGVNRKSIVAACLFFACMRKGVTRTSKEIASMWGISESDMNKGRRNLQKLFKIKDKAKKAMINTETSKPEHFIRRYCNAMKIKNQYIEDALKIAINVEKLNLASNHTPCSSAAASILLMAEINELDHINKKKLSVQFEISDSTIFKTYKEIEPYKHVLINNDSTDEIVKEINKEMIVQDIPQEVIDRMKQFGIVPDIKIQTNTINKNTNSGINSDVDIDVDVDVDSDLELEEDEYICDDFTFGYDIINPNDVVDAVDAVDEVDEHDSNKKIELSLQEKYISINKILKNKSLNDLEEEMKILMSSHNLIKEIVKDINQYKKIISKNC